MITKINFILPYAILAAARHRHRVVVNNGKAFSSTYNPQKKKAEWIDTQLLAKAYMQKNKFKPINKACRAFFEVGLSVPRSWSKKNKDLAYKAVIHPCDKRKKDFDNLAKFICDCLNGICYEDDGLITDGRLIKKYAEHPYTSVLIEEIKSE